MIDNMLQAKVVEDFIKYVEGNKRYRKAFNHFYDCGYEKDELDYYHWLTVYYWSLPVYDKDINKILLFI
jgi:hypothetical protein